MPGADEQGRDAGPDQRPQHIPISIENIPLGSHDRVDWNIEQLDRGEFRQLVGSTQTQTGQDRMTISERIRPFFT